MAMTDIGATPEKARRFWKCAWIVSVVLGALYVPVRLLASVAIRNSYQSIPFGRMSVEASAIMYRWLGSVLPVFASVSYVIIQACVVMAAMWLPMRKALVVWAICAYIQVTQILSGFMWVSQPQPINYYVITAINLIVTVSASLLLLYLPRRVFPRLPSGKRFLISAAVYVAIRYILAFALSILSLRLTSFVISDQFGHALMRLLGTLWLSVLTWAGMIAVFAITRWFVNRPYSEKTQRADETSSPE